MISAASLVGSIGLRWKSIGVDRSVTRRDSGLSGKPTSGNDCCRPLAVGEQRIENPCVGGSIPPRATKNLYSPLVGLFSFKA